MVITDRNKTEIQEKVGKRERIGQIYYSFFREHYVSRVVQLNQVLAKKVFEAMYKNTRLWEYSVLGKDADQKEILFIHIPKCAGTSIASIFNHAHLPHFPASVLYLLDKERFMNSESFAIVRHPVDRIASIITHYNSSQFSSSKEKEIAKRLNLSQENLRENIIKFMTDDEFRYQLFNFTKPGRHGFPLSQLEYIQLDGEILVKKLFAFSHIHKLEAWLSEKTGETVIIPKKNSSGRKTILSLDSELVELCRDYCPQELDMYEEISISGEITI